MRRKVVSASQTNRRMWLCKLECGHYEIALGRRQKNRIGVPEAPKTTSCMTCKNQKQESESKGE